MQLNIYLAMKADDEDDYGEDDHESDLFTLLTALRGILMTSIPKDGKLY